MSIHQIKEEIERAVRRSDERMDEPPVREWLERPPKPDMGDFGLPCFKLAPVLREDPSDIADELAAGIELPESCSKVSAEGPYLNFFIDRAPFMDRVLEEVLDQPEDWAYDDVGEGEPVVVDYSSPNIAKPFSVGHLRSTAIGAVLYRLYDRLGFQTIGINHLGDWGTQCGKQLLAFEKWGDRAELEEKGVHYLQDLYVRINDEIENDPELQERCREWFSRLEQGDEHATELWRLFREQSIDYLESIYDRLGVTFDEYIGESFYHDRTGNVLEEVEASGLLTESEGALIVQLDNGDKPPFLLRKADGSTLYSTRDLAAALYRHREYDADRLIYVVASEQNLHFQQLFSVLRKMGHDWVDACEHVDFGLVQVEGGKMSTRQGDVVLLDDLMERGIQRTREILENRREHFDDPSEDPIPDHLDRDEIARSIGIGAVLFSDLKDDRTRDVTFDWDRAIGYDPETGSFRGETGPYLQYTHVRLHGLRREAEKAGVTRGSEEGRYAPWETGDDDSIPVHRLERPEEFYLVRELAFYPEVLKRTLHTHKPSVLAGYLVDLAQRFNRYYHDREHHQVISDDRELTVARLAMCEAIRSVLSSGLNILGIDALKWM